MSARRVLAIAAIVFPIAAISFAESDLTGSRMSFFDAPACFRSL